MTTMTKRMMLAVLVANLALYGCDEEGDPDAGVDVDSGPDDTDAGGGGEDSGTPEDAGGGGDTPTCEAYCDNVTTNCTGANQQYADEAECLETCEGFGWEAGDAVTAGGPLSGNSIGCRTYHGGAPAVEGPALHCPHAGPTGGNTCGTWCEVYCAAALEVCTGDEAIYADMAECMTACTPLDDEAAPGVTDGDSVQCRLYHLNVALVSGDTAMHCPHAAADGGGVCIGGWNFNAADISTPAMVAANYTRVDRMGMPAIATALVGTLTEADDMTARYALKDDYNDDNPEDDTAANRGGEFTNNLLILHGVLRDDLTDSPPDGAGLTDAQLCVDYGTLGVTPDDVSECIAQAAPLVLPDVLSVDRTAPVTFPNGRDLPDKVIDLTLGVILLDTPGGDTAGGGIDGTELVGTNPETNDATFLTTFPYLAPPHEPAP